MRRADEVVIIKAANYTDMLSSCVCISNNAYKVYVQREESAAFGGHQPIPTEASPNKYNSSKVNGPAVGPSFAPNIAPYGVGPPDYQAAN